MDNFKGSIAQKNVQFPIEVVIEPLAGENYSRAMIFIPVSQVPEYLSGIEGAEAGKLYALASNNYAELTGGMLKKHLIPFFKSATTGTVGIAIYDDGSESTDTLPVVYEKFKMYAYFKFGLAETSKYKDLQTELSNLCLTDSLYSDLWIGTSDTNVLSSNSALVQELVDSKSNARVIYNPDSSINPALAQLGKTLSSINATGTPVGNSIDMVSFSTVPPSGSTDADGDVQNLSSTEISELDKQKIGYNTSVGDGTSNVVTEGSLTLQGESVGANWVRNYITYMCKSKTANFITQMNKFRNNTTYQAILLILIDQVKGFVDMGRLDDFEITAPPFAELPESGDGITVPNAWKATYIDNTREVTVYGTLYMTQPSK